jgi:outer membrane receptor for ferrienterochelin and colicin
MKIIFFLACLLLPFIASGQSVSGKVTNDKNNPLSYANVYWHGTTIVVSTGPDGSFKITSRNITDKRLVASFVGHTPDTIAVTDQLHVDFVLKETQTLNEVVVTGRRNGVQISDLKPIKTEQLTSTELKKAACCDLAGCFDTQNSVQPQVTNVITNAKELRILGLSGTYNQVLVDGLPLIRGLSYTYGVSSIPGTLVNSIHISKGANSVVQGYESISGQINVETKDPVHSDKLFLNLYVNSYLEKQLNAHYSVKKGKWGNLTAIHAVLPANKIDKDDDKFLDLPLLQRYMVSNKWTYGNEHGWGWHNKTGFRYLNESRTGGQMNFNSKTDKGGNSVYGQTVSISQPEVWTKTGYRFSDRQHLVLNSSAYYQEQKSYFGTVKYNAQQINFYANLQFELNYGKHFLNSGLSFRHQNLKEDISFSDNVLQRTYDGNYRFEENIPGIFAENTFHLLDGKLTWITGIRADYHERYGNMITPRTLLKFDITPTTIVRANIGTGWRTVNLFSENIGLLASSRDIIIPGELLPEEAVNMGMNFTKKFGNGNDDFSGYFSSDFYRTHFSNQIFPDYDADPLKVVVDNFNGKSISNGFQAELNITLLKLYDLKFGYNYLDVFFEKEGFRQVLPFNPKHKLLGTFGYKSRNNKFFFDLNMHWFGEQRLPDTKSNPEPYRRPDYSKPYSVVSTQVTYNFGKFEVYTGMENIFNYRQNQPIISWQDPFGPYFDTSSAWGPTRGREFYAGIRLRLK